MYKVKKDNDCFTIRNEIGLANVEPIVSSHTHCSAIYVVFGVFSLFENSNVIAPDSKIILFEAVEAFGDYPKSIGVLNKFTNVTHVNICDPQAKTQALDLLREYSASEIKVMMNSNVFRMEKEAYMRVLEKINHNLKHPKKIEQAAEEKVLTQ